MPLSLCLRRVELIAKYQSRGPPKKPEVDSDEEDEATTDNELELKKK